MLLGDVSTPIRIERSPCLLESPDLFPADDREPIAPLVDVREAFEDQRDKERDENVHADDVP